MTYDLRLLGGFRLRAPKKAAVAELPDLDPDATIAKWTSRKRGHDKNPKPLEHLRAHLRKAGLPA